jgi:DNA-binding NarL/FixJ family response regulator
MAKSNRITHSHRVNVELDDKKIVFIAEPDDSRLIIREEDENSRELCSLTLANPEELSAFFEGLKRIFVSTNQQQQQQQPVISRRTGADRPAQRSLPTTTDQNEDDREEIISRARTRNPNAFKGWSKSEEGELRQRYQKGEPIKAIAQALKRSEKAIEMRLKRMGLLPDEENELAN